MLASDRPLYLRARTYDAYNGRGWEQSDLVARDVVAGEPLFPDTVLERPDRRLRRRRLGDRHRDAPGDRAQRASRRDRRCACSRRSPCSNRRVSQSTGPSNGRRRQRSARRTRCRSASRARPKPSSPWPAPTTRTRFVASTSTRAGSPDRVAQLARGHRRRRRCREPVRPGEGAGGVPDRTRIRRTPRPGPRSRATATSSTRSSSGMARAAATASTTRAPWRSWRGRSGCPHALRPASHPERRPAMASPSSGRRTPTPGSRSTSPAMAGRSSRRRSRSIPRSYVPPVTGRPPSPPSATVATRSVPGPSRSTRESHRRSRRCRLRSSCRAASTRASRPPDPSSGNDSRTGNVVIMIALAVGAAAVIWFQMRRSQRRWRLMPAGERAWKQLTLAADRAGVGPRPSETIYEYTGWLEDQLPKHVEPIRTVADGKVWQSYSGRRLSSGSADRLDAAWARLRLPLIGLAARRRLGRFLRRGRRS